MADLTEPCGHEPPQSAAQLHGVCIFCWRDRAFQARREALLEAATWPAKVLHPDLVGRHAARDAIANAIRALADRKDKPPCTRCGDAYRQHPWSETHHSGCDAKGCDCAGYEE